MPSQLSQDSREPAPDLCLLLFSRILARGPFARPRLSEELFHQQEADAHAVVGPVPAYAVTKSTGCRHCSGFEEPQGGVLAEDQVRSQGLG